MSSWKLRSAFEVGIKIGSSPGLEFGLLIISSEGTLECHLCYDDQCSDETGQHAGNLTACV